MLMYISAVWFCLTVVSTQQEYREENVKRFIDNRHCYGLPPISHGRYSCSTSSSHYARVGETCRIVCHSGYTLTGGHTSTTCQGNERWSSHGTCSNSVTSCSTPPSVSNGHFTCHTRVSGHYTKGDTCQVVCNNGYKPSPANDAITCSGSHLWTGHAVCTEMSCSTPAVVSNGHFTCNTSVSGHYTLGDTCQVVCNNGYKPSPGNDVITCTGNHLWTGHAVCTDNHCPAPGNISGGLFVCALSRVYGSTCQLYCSAGHMVRGATQITCQNNQQWTQPGSCTAVQCPFPPVVENGKYRCPTTSYTHGETCLLECNKGFHPATHHHNITCQPDETWSAATSCVEGCPQGTFTNTTLSGVKYCEFCPKGSYQTLEGSSVCIPCPLGWSTAAIGSTEVTSCTAMCRPGTVSTFGLEPCHLCPLGTYQNQTGATTCMTCPGGHTTIGVGSSLPQHCVEKKP